MVVCTEIGLLGFMQLRHRKLILNTASVYLISNLDWPIHNAAKCKEFNGCNSFFPILNNHQIAFFLSLHNDEPPFVQSHTVLFQKFKQLIFSFKTRNASYKDTLSIWLSHACLSSP